jgi:hypothetical protein
MKRTPLARTTPLAQGPGPERRTPIKARNPKRRASRWTIAFGSPERVGKIRALPCCACGRLPSENAHVVSRSAGGTWRDIVPLCGGPAGCHALQHRVGIETVQREWGVDLRALADRLAREVTP